VFVLGAQRAYIADPGERVRLSEAVAYECQVMVRSGA